MVQAHSRYSRRKPAQVIGWVRFDRGDTVLLATLSKKGKWACPDEYTEAMLNTSFNPFNEENRSPAFGGFGHWPLRAAGSRLGGTVEFAVTLGPAPPGRDY